MTVCARRITSTSSWPTPTVSTSTSPRPACVHQVDRVGGRARQTAQGTTCGHRADEDAGVERQVAHADAIAEDRATGERRGRIDGEDSNGTAARPSDQRERPREGALAAAGGTGDADDLGTPGARIEASAQRFGASSAGLDPREPARERARRALRDLARQDVDV
jgi:hypothetical protein